MHRLS